MMCRDLLSYHLRTLPRVFAILKPDFIMLSEDMSYRNGPMLSEKFFNEFLAPYYRELVPFLKENDVPLFLDSDGNFSEMIPWLLAVGMDAQAMSWQPQIPSVRAAASVWQLCRITSGTVDYWNARSSGPPTKKDTCTTGSAATIRLDVQLSQRPIGAWCSITTIRSRPRVSATRHNGTSHSPWPPSQSLAPHRQFCSARQVIWSRTQETNHQATQRIPSKEQP